MDPEFSIYRQKNSPYYRVVFRSWDASKGRFVRLFKTTKATTLQQATLVASAYVTATAKAAPDGEGKRPRFTRESILDAVNAVLTLAGVDAVIHTMGWKSYAEQWLQAKKTSQREGSRSAESFKTHINHFTKFLADKEQPLNTLTTQQLRAFQKAQVERGISGGTVNNIIQTIDSILKQAAAEGYMPRNPMDLVAKVEEETREKDPLTLKEIQQVLDYLTETKDLTEEEKRDWKTATLIGICTGQRLRDCTNAMWTHIERKSPWWVWTNTQLKTGTRVEIPIVGPLAKHLRTLDTGDSLYLCPSLAGRPAGGATVGLSAEFIAILDAAGVKGTVVKPEGEGYTWRSKTFHSLRHTCNSIMANEGVSMDVRRKIIGHASDKMNARYTHLEIATSAKALAGAIGGALSPKKKATKKKAG